MAKARVCSLPPAPTRWNNLEELSVMMHIQASVTLLAFEDNGFFSGSIGSI
jgi:hypothetical protein